MDPFQPHTLLLVEVIPLISSPDNDVNTSQPDVDDTVASLPTTCSPISAPLAKMQLLNMGRQIMFSNGWLGAEENTKERSKSKRGKRSGASESIEADDGNDRVMATDHHRGLWLQIDTHKGDEDHDTHIKQQHYINNDRQIISGVLIFKGRDKQKSEKQHTSHSSKPLTYLLSDDPLDELGMPCQLIGHLIPRANDYDNYNQISDIRCVISNDTMVQVLPPIDVSRDEERLLCAVLSGRINTAKQSSSPAYSLVQAPTTSTISYSPISSYDEETVKALSLRMNTMLSSTVWIGSTPSALAFRKDQQQLLQSMDAELDSFFEGKSASDAGLLRERTANSNQASENVIPLLLREGALLVYNSHSNTGKTTLVKTIAKDILKCNAIRTISAPALFAKYGASTDAALESILHELAFHGAVEGGSSAKVCIILDHFDSFLHSSSNAEGDPYLPVLNAMGKKV
jgi:hypothetical protein